MSLTLDLGLGIKVATQHPLEGSTSIDLNSCIVRKLIKIKGPNEYYLMIRNNVVNHIVQPNLACIDVLNERNLLYPLDAHASTNAHAATEDGIAILM